MALGVELEAIDLQPDLLGRAPDGRAPAQISAVRCPADQLHQRRDRRERDFEDLLQPTEHAVRAERQRRGVGRVPYERHDHY